MYAGFVAMEGVGYEESKKRNYAEDQEDAEGDGQGYDNGKSLKKYNIYII